MKKLILILTLISISVAGFNQSEVPQEVIDNYKASFIYNDAGLVVGANIDELREYMTEGEILLMVEADVTKVYNQIGAEGPTPKIFGSKKPKSNGCRKNRRWVCVIYGDVVSM